MSSLPAFAKLTGFESRRTPEAIEDRTGSRTEQTSKLASLRQDIAAHPQDFVVFETIASIDRFISEHSPEAQREAEPRVAQRGIIGYWRGKTLVLLPTLSAILR